VSQSLRKLLTWQVEKGKALAMRESRFAPR